jgi:uncharacterized protein (TIGR02996 family)
MTVTERDPFDQLSATPDDAALRMVYADWLEQRGDRRGAFLRACDRVWAMAPDHPARLAHETELSRLRLGLDPAWLAVIEPQPDDTPSCECYREAVPRLHREVQDTECDGWKRLLDYIERCADEQRMRFQPRPEMSFEEWRRIRTLPPSIAKLTSITTIEMYGSNLVRLPPEIGQMASLRSIDFYTSYRLHWYPYELLRAPALRGSKSSTRTLYGNFKNRMVFPALATPGTGVRRPCSVCDAPFDDHHEFRVWLSQRVPSDVLPLLVNACSQACVDRLPAPPDGHVAHPHRGGADVVQPKPGRSG